MHTTPAPAMLSGHDCWDLLEDDEVERVVWTGADGVSIVPVVGMEVWASGLRSLFVRVTPIEVSGRRLRGRLTDHPQHATRG